MPFCPKCKYEYRPEVSTCPDCDVPLVAHLEPDAEETDPLEGHTDWTPIARMTSPQYAEMILEALRSKDIPALLHDTSGHFGQTGQMGTSSFRPIAGAVTALFVPLRFVEDAAHETAIILGEDWDRVKLVDID
jgi:hypothetical protein